MTRARAAGVVLLLAAAVAWALPATARATEVSAQEFQALATEAVDSPEALAELRRVDSVDGRRVDVRGALRGARDEDLEVRLQTLERTVAEESETERNPRQDAREVLAQSRFHGSSVPGPFKGLLEELGRLVPDIDVPLDWLDDLLPGGRSVVWIALGAIFAGLAWLIARRVLTRRIRVSTEAADAVAEQAGADPKALERSAAEAEAAGDLELALRLRFRAGLLRLDARGAIEFRPSISTYEVRRALRSEDFNALAATFDDVVYGGRPPEGADVAAARDRWPAVVSAARAPAEAAA